MVLDTILDYGRYRLFSEQAARAGTTADDAVVSFSFFLFLWVGMKDERMLMRDGINGSDFSCVGMMDVIRVRVGVMEFCCFLRKNDLFLESIATSISYDVCYGGASSSSILHNDVRKTMR